MSNLPAPTHAGYLAASHANRHPDDRVVVCSITDAAAVLDAVTEALAELLDRRFAYTCPDLRSIVDAALSPLVRIQPDAKRRFTGEVYDISLGFTNAAYTAVRAQAKDCEKLQDQWGFSGFVSFLEPFITQPPAPAKAT